MATNTPAPVINTIVTPSTSNPTRGYQAVAGGTTYNTQANASKAYDAMKAEGSLSVNASGVIVANPPIQGVSPAVSNAYYAAGGVDPSKSIIDNKTITGSPVIQTNARLGTTMDSAVANIKSVANTGQPIYDSTGKQTGTAKFDAITGKELTDTTKTPVTTDTSKTPVKSEIPITDDKTGNITFPNGKILDKNGNVVKDSTPEIPKDKIVSSYTLDGNGGMVLTFSDGTSSSLPPPPELVLAHKQADEATANTNNDYQTAVETAKQQLQTQINQNNVDKESAITALREEMGVGSPTSGENTTLTSSIANISAKFDSANAQLTESAQQNLTSLYNTHRSNLESIDNQLETVRQSYISNKTSEFNTTLKGFDGTPLSSSEYEAALKQGISSGLTPEEAKLQVEQYQNKASVAYNLKLQAQAKTDFLAYNSAFPYNGKPENKAPYVKMLQGSGMSDSEINTFLNQQGTQYLKNEKLKQDEANSIVNLNLKQEKLIDSQIKANQQATTQSAVAGAISSATSTGKNPVESAIVASAGGIQLKPGTELETFISQLANYKTLPTQLSNVATALNNSENDGRLKSWAFSHPIGTPVRDGELATLLDTLPGLTVAGSSVFGVTKAMLRSYQEQLRIQSAIAGQAGDPVKIRKVILSEFVKATQSSVDDFFQLRAQGGMNVAPYLKDYQDLSSRLDTTYSLTSGVNPISDLDTSGIDWSALTNLSSPQ